MFSYNNGNNQGMAQECMLILGKEVTHMEMRVIKRFSSKGHWTVCDQEY